MTGHATAVARYVSCKVSRVCWEPPSRADTLQPRTLFATGSWDDEANKISVWTAGAEGRVTEESMHEEGYDQLGATEPELLCSAAHVGNVTDLLYVSSEALLASSSTGGVTLYKYQSTNQTLVSDRAWPALHGAQSPCTALTVQDWRFVSVGEDGVISVVDLGQGGGVQRIGSADSCTLNDVCFIAQQCVAVVNSIGQFKVWDLRDASHQPSKVLLLSGSRVPLQCIAQHPSQSHVLATGGQDGMLYMWDMRQDKLPVTLLKAHTSCMWDVQFHAIHPNHLFSCSNDGALWHWRNSVPQTATFGLFNKGRSVTNETDVALTCASDWTTASQRHLEITDLLTGANVMSVNSLDTTDTRLVCGTDSEQIIVVRNLAVF